MADIFIPEAILYSDDFGDNKTMGEHLGGIRVFRQVNNLSSDNYGLLRSAMRSSTEGLPLPAVRFEPTHPPRLTLLSALGLQSFYRIHDLPFTQSNVYALADHINMYRVPRGVDEPREIPLRPVVRDNGETASSLYFEIDEALVAELGLLKKAVQELTEIEVPLDGAWDVNDAEVGVKVAHAKNVRAHELMDALLTTVNDNQPLLVPDTLDLQYLEIEDTVI